MIAVFVAFISGFAIAVNLSAVFMSGYPLAEAAPRLAVASFFFIAALVSTFKEQDRERRREGK